MKTGAAFQINLFASKPRQSDDFQIESMRYELSAVCALCQSKATLACLLSGPMHDIMSTGGSGKDGSSIGALVFGSTRLASMND
jgi:hypothetical protein